MEIELRNISEADLKEYAYWKLPIHEYHNYNGPYFKKSTKEEVKKEIQLILAEIRKGNKKPILNKKLISTKENQILGEVSWYWKSKETFWLEVGIVIFDAKFWGKGIGKQALRLWIKDIFESKEEIIRIGLSTWSGNKGMMKLAENLNMKKEAEYRKARIVEGKYFDSVSYGILRDEWEQIRV